MATKTARMLRRIHRGRFTNGTGISYHGTTRSTLNGRLAAWMLSTSVEAMMDQDPLGATVGRGMPTWKMPFWSVNT